MEEQTNLFGGLLELVMSALRSVVVGLVYVAEDLATFGALDALENMYMSAYHYTVNIHVSSHG
jgi:hypothetical protein